MKNLKNLFFLLLTVVIFSSLSGCGAIMQSIDEENARYDSETGKVINKEGVSEDEWWARNSMRVALINQEIKDEEEVKDEDLVGLYTGWLVNDWAGTADFKIYTKGGRRVASALLDGYSKEELALPPGKYRREIRVRDGDRIKVFTDEFPIDPTVPTPINFRGEKLQGYFYVRYGY